MSLKVMTLVWDYFPGKGNELICMLKLADKANDEGGGLWASVAYMASAMRVSHRQAQRIVNSLIDEQWLEVTDKMTGRGYRRLMQINIQKLLQCEFITLADCEKKPEKKGDTSDTLSETEQQERVTHLTPFEDLGYVHNWGKTGVQKSGRVTSGAVKGDIAMSESKRELNVSNNLVISNDKSVDNSDESISGQEKFQWLKRALALGLTQHDGEDWNAFICRIAHTEQHPDKQKTVLQEGGQQQC